MPHDLAPSSWLSRFFVLLLLAEFLPAQPFFGLLALFDSLAVPK
jgi:hypothetical protein